MKPIFVGAPWALLLCALAFPQMAFAQLDAAEVAKGLGYDKEDRDKLLSGEIVSHQLGHEEKDELAATVAMLLKSGVPALFEHMKKGDVFEVDKTVLSHGVISERPATAASLSGLKLDPKELEKLAKVEAGSTFNLSSAEIKAIRDATRGGAIAVANAYRTALAARVEAYRKGGVGAIAAYDRGGKQSSPAEELQHANEQMKVLAKAVPDFYRAIVNYPKDPLKGFTNEYSWSVQQVQDRPTAVLIHRMFGVRDGGAFLISRQFYAGQSYNVLQVGVGLLPVKQGTVVFYTNRTFTDQVAGFGSGAAHKIGRRMMVKEVEKLFESIRTAFDKS